MPKLMLAHDLEKLVVIDYMNWERRRAERTILPLSVVWERTKWHPEAQWVMRAVDAHKGTIRHFALANTHSWRPAPCPPPQ